VDRWIRQNVLGLIAIFIALSGSAVATQVAHDGAHSAKAKKGPRGPAGPAGLQGPPGAPGAQGPVGPSTGNAGGDLTGSYPNPEIGLGKVGAPELADFTVGVSKFAFDIPWARATRTGNQSIPDSTDTVLAFDSERYDSAGSPGLHDNVTNNSRMTAPASGSIGIFAVTASVHFAANGTGLRTVTLRRNGTTNVASQTVQAVSGAPTTVNLNSLVLLSGSGSAYLEVVVSQSSGGALDVIKSDEVSPEFSISYLPSND
jgi:hypothetical protein